MIRSRLFPAVLLSLGACAAAVEVPAIEDKDGQIDVLLERLEDENGPVMVVAHRACWADGAPENSLSAIEECISLGADMIEIDVAITKDGVPVVFHDETVDRTTNGIGEITELTLAEARELRLRAGEGGPDQPLTDEIIPTLEEALALSDDKILINLDVKGDVFTQAFKVVEAVGVEDQILMKMSAAPDAPALENAAFRGKTLFMPIIRECTPRDINRNCAPQLSKYAPQYEDYDPVAFEITYSTETFFSEGVEAMTEADGRIWVNTLSPPHAAGVVDEDAVNDPDSTWGRVIRLGANMIQTDNPRELIEYLEANAMR